MENNNITLSLHARQSLAFSSTATEILYGGAAGGGKSHLMRVKAIAVALMVKGAMIYLFRRISADLIKNHMEGADGFRNMLAPLIQSGDVRIIADTQIVFSNGSKIFLCHCQHEKDKYKYQGAEIHLLLIDELTHFSEGIYKYLRGRVRLGGLQAPKNIRLPCIICGSNPGGVGHDWVKKTFIDYATPMKKTKTPKDEGGMVRQYIPARLEDNPTMTQNDPEYLERLSGLGSETLVAAMRDGNWDIAEGAFFDCFDRAIHVKTPFHIPPHWTRLRAMDWGYSAPFCVLWGAVSDGEIVGVPKGAIVIYREYYGGDNNKGLKMTAEAIAQEVKTKSKDERYAINVADPAIFAQNGGISIAEAMAKNGVHWYPADNARVAGWQQIIQRLKGTAESEHKPLLFVFNHCIHLLRTLPVLQHDPMKVEDLNTHMEDHAADTLRYLCMTRPLTGTKKEAKTTVPQWLK